MASTPRVCTASLARPVGRGSSTRFWRWVRFSLHSGWYAQNVVSGTWRAPSHIVFFLLGQSSAWHDVSPIINWQLSCRLRTAIVRAMFFQTLNFSFLLLSLKTPETLNHFCSFLICSLSLLSLSLSNLFHSFLTLVRHFSHFNAFLHRSWGSVSGQLSHPHRHRSAKTLAQRAAGPSHDLYPLQWFYECCGWVNNRSLVIFIQEGLISVYAFVLSCICTCACSAWYNNS